MAVGMEELAEAVSACGACAAPLTSNSAGHLNLHVWAPAFTGFGGGIAAFSREMVNGLQELGHSVRLYGKNDRSGTWPGHHLTGSGIFVKPVRTIRFAASGLAGAGSHRPDHIISTHVNFGPVAQLAKRMFGVPFTLVAHGIDVHPGLPLRTLAAMRESQRIIAVSHWTRDRVLDLGGIEPRNVTILPNTVDESRFTIGEKPAALRKRYDIGPDEKIILTVARLDPSERYKGYDRIVEALPKIRADCGPVRFLIVGAGDDRARVATLARERNVEALVSFAGFVQPAELADHYRLADVFAMPITGEGFGVVFLEAMGCGTPVVAGNRDGSVDALDGGRLGLLVDPTNVDAIGEGISALLRREGPATWYDRQALHDAASDKFGHDAFLVRLRESLGFGV
jgi:glycosyltransferase involved in cell wall biosynthesis